MFATKRLRTLLALLLALVLVGAAAACSSSEPTVESTATTEEAPGTTAGTEPPGTTSTVPASGHVAQTVEVATAKGATVDVYQAKPGVPSSKITQPPAGRVQPIPRADLNSAGSRATDSGWQFDNPTYFGNPLVFVVEENQGDWLKVHVPVRPNGSMGWVKASQVTLSEHQYAIEVSLSEAKVRAWSGSELLGEGPVVHGAAGSPTPVGTFYINEKIPQSYAGGAYGPWILSTSAYSESMELFDNGLPVVALHGTNQPGLLGSAVSNGCVRMQNDLVTLLANAIPAGTPVTVTA